MTWWSTSCRRLIEAKKAGASNDPQNGGIQTSHWFWAAANRIRGQKEAVTTDVPTLPLTPVAAAVDKAVEEQTADQKVNEIILENPQVSGAALVNTMKSKGLQVVKTTEAWRNRVSKLSLVTSSKNTRSIYRESTFFGALTTAMSKHKSTPAKEASTSSAATQVTRTMEAKFRFGSNLRESSSDDGIGPTKFRVVLLQEGMGNFGDAYYYSREALESAVTIFTGSKIYADHPTTVEEEIRPERSVRDVLGHFENLMIETDKTERAMLCGDVNILPNKPFEWARSLMIRAIENAKKFPEKDFIGLSINASGDAEEMPIDVLMKSAPASARPKLVEAKENGIESVKVVREIKSAISCDLVTEAGAGGKIINTIEGR